MVHDSVLYDLAKTAYLGKIWFFSYGLKYSQPIRLQHSLIVNIFARSQSIPQILCMKITINIRKDQRLPLGLVWPIVPLVQSGAGFFYR